MQTKRIGQENQWGVNNHQICLKQFIEAPTYKVRRGFFERIEGLSVEQQKQTEAVNKSQSKCMGLGGLTLHWTTPNVCKQGHPHHPEQKRAFTCSPCGGKSVLERKSSATIRHHVVNACVIDEEAACQRNERKNHQRMKPDRRKFRLLMQSWTEKKHRRCEEGKPERRPPHGC